MKKRLIKAAEKTQSILLTMKRRAIAAISNEEGMGTVEVILIILVLIGLVIIFKSQLNDLVNSIFEKIVKQAKSI